MHLHHEHTADGPSIDEEKAYCPVIHIPDSKAEAVKGGLVRSYHGHTHYLYCNACANQWDKNPTRYNTSEEGGIVWRKL